MDSIRAPPNGSTSVGYDAPTSRRFSRASMARRDASNPPASRTEGKRRIEGFEEDAMSGEGHVEVETTGGRRSRALRNPTFRSDVAEASEIVSDRGGREAEVRSASAVADGLRGSPEAHASVQPSTGRRPREGMEGSDNHGFDGESEGRSRKAIRTSKHDRLQGEQFMADVESPQGHRPLQRADLRGNMVGEVLKVYWPDDGSWWSGKIIEIGPKFRSVTVLYESGDLENISGEDLKEVLSKGHLLINSDTEHTSPALEAAGGGFQNSAKAIDSSNDRIVTSAYPHLRQTTPNGDRQEHESVCDMPPADTDMNNETLAVEDSMHRSRNRNQYHQEESAERGVASIIHKSLQVGLDKQASVSAHVTPNHSRRASQGNYGLIAVGSQILAGVQLENSTVKTCTKPIKAESTAEGNVTCKLDVSNDFDWQLQLHQSRKRSRGLHSDRTDWKNERGEESILSDPGATWDPPDGGMTAGTAAIPREAMSSGRAISPANASHDSHRSPMHRRTAQNIQDMSCRPSHVGQEVSCVSDVEYPGQRLEQETSIHYKHSTDAMQDGEFVHQQADGPKCKTKPSMASTPQMLMNNREESVGFAFRAIRADSNVTDAQHPLEPEHTVVTDLGTIHGMAISGGDPVPSTAHAFSEDSKSAIARSNRDTSVVSSDARVIA